MENFIIKSTQDDSAGSGPRGAGFASIATGIGSALGPLGDSWVRKESTERSLAWWEFRWVALCRPQCYWPAGVLGQLAMEAGELCLLLMELFKLISSRTARLLLRPGSSSAQPWDSQVRRQWEACGSLISMLYVYIFCSDVLERPVRICAHWILLNPFHFPGTKISSPPSLFLPFVCCSAASPVPAWHTEMDDVLPLATLKTGCPHESAVHLTSHSCGKITPQGSFLQFHQQNLSEESFSHLSCLLDQIYHILKRYIQT